MNAFEKPSQISSIRFLTTSCVSLFKVLTVPFMKAVSGIMLYAVPEWIWVIDITMGFNAGILREDIYCIACEIWAAMIIGSTVCSG